jgi:RNA polymerase sigma-70 factor (ECF subfamily)
MTDDEFERFYHDTAGQLHAYLARLGGDEWLADDLLQSAYVRVLRARDVPGDPRPRRVYLFRVATNLLRDEWRRRGTDRRREETLAGGTPSSDADGAWGFDRPVAADAESLESRLEVRKALAEVTPRDRELLWLAYALDMSHGEIAEVAGVAAASVRVLLQRARRRFVTVVERYGVGSEETGSGAPGTGREAGG